MSANRSRWVQLLEIARPLFAPAVRVRTLTLLGIIVALVVSLNGLNVVNSYVGRGFMTALANRDIPAFYSYTFFYAGVFLASTIVAVLYQFLQSRLALFWRQWLTRQLLERYLTNEAYYHLHFRAEIDNPDQRLSEDVRSFTTTLLSFFLLALNSSITIVAFAAILWSIDPRLFVSAVVYTLVGSLATVWLGRRLVHLNYVQLAREADLRYGLVHIREYAEPIALLRGEPEERSQVSNRLDQLVEVIRRVIAVNRNMGFFTSFFNYLVPVLPVVIIAPSYLRGEIEFGVVTQSAMAFAQFLGGLAVFIEQFQNISTFAAVITRLGALQHSLREVVWAKASNIRIRRDDDRIAFERLTLKTPGDGRVLIANLSLEIGHGRRLLIQGSDGAGKSALFRATAGLWSEGNGTIYCPHRDRMMFLPQKPYTVFGTLRDQLLYGLHDHLISGDRLRQTLRDVKLDTVVERVGGLDVERNWPTTLSIGEQQLLAFARLLLAEPDFAFLDQAVSSLGPRRGKSLYKLLAESSITFLSVGDHSHILEFHDDVLELADDGSWTTHSTKNAGGGVTSLAERASAP